MYSPFCRAEIFLLPGKSGSARPARHFRLREKSAWEGNVSETQAYKKDLTFTLPASGLDITRSLFAQRLKTVEAVCNDPNANRVFTRNELSNMAFECLMLAKMLKSMPTVPEVGNA
jgi:hypothetical protein